MKNEKIIKCLLCENPAELIHNNYTGYQEPHTFRIYHCSNCNTAFSLPIVDTSELYDNIYKNGDMVPGYSRYWKYAKNIKKIDKPLDYLAKTEETYWSIKEALALYVKEKTTTNILEIGSGLGYLTFSLIQDGYNVIGLDISRTAVSKANKTFGNYYICAELFEYADLYPETYDIVILTEVIEHIDQPLDFIKSIMKLMKPGGYSIITTPNKSFYPKDIIWRSSLPPVHYWWFSEESFNYIAKRLKLDIGFIKFREFYKNFYRAVDMKIVNQNNRPNPVFNKNSKLILKSKINSKYLYSIFSPFVYAIQRINNIFRKLKELQNSNIKICEERGIILCAILEKSDH